MGAENQPHKGIAFLQLFGNVLLLHHAAAQPDQRVRTAALDVFERPHIAKHAILGVFPHRAGVEQNQIRVVRRFGEREAHVRQHSFHAFGIRHVLLAAVGAYIAKRRFIAFAVGVIRPHPFNIGLLLFPLFLRQARLFLLFHSPNPYTEILTNKV